MQRTNEAWLWIAFSLLHVQGACRHLHTCQGLHCEECVLSVCAARYTVFLQRNSTAKDCVLQLFIGISVVNNLQELPVTETIGNFLADATTKDSKAVPARYG